ncbi:MAG TPA: hypothetical protein VHL30_03970, partial [Chlamydiales bacterium]|nr:hypothetical protein [Chlamydiales bacterium]
RALANTPVANGPNPTIVDVANAAISEAIPPLREATAPPKMVQFPYGSRPIVKDGMIVQIPNPTPSDRPARICTVQDLPPEEDPSVTEMRQTVRETVESLKKFEDGFRADQEMFARIDQLGVAVQNEIASKQKIIEDRQEILATRKDLIERLIRLVEKSMAREDKLEAELDRAKADVDKIILQTNRYLEQNTQNGFVPLFVSQEPDSTFLSESNLLGRNWKVLGGKVFCMITLVAIAVIFGMVAAVLSVVLVIGTIFWKNCENKSSFEQLSSQSFPDKQSYYFSLLDLNGGEHGNTRII